MPLKGVRGQFVSNLDLINTYLPQQNETYNIVSAGQALPSASSGLSANGNDNSSIEQPINE